MQKYVQKDKNKVRIFIQFKTLRYKEILKDDKHDWSVCNFEKCNYWGQTQCLRIVLGKNDPTKIDLLSHIHKKN